MVVPLIRRKQAEETKAPSHKTCSGRCSPAGKLSPCFTPTQPGREKAMVAYMKIEVSHKMKKLFARIGPGTLSSRKQNVARMRSDTSWLVSFCPVYAQTGFSIVFCSFCSVQEEHADESARALSQDWLRRAFFSQTRCYLILCQGER